MHLILAFSNKLVSLLRDSVKVRKLQSRETRAVFLCSGILTKSKNCEAEKPGPCFSASQIRQNPKIAKQRNQGRVSLLRKLSASMPYEGEGWKIVA